MRRTGIKIATFSLLLLLGAVAVLADGKSLKDSITIAQEATVNDVKIKPGTYQATFNAETNEVNILKEGRVVATVKASVQQSGAKKSRETQVYYSSTDKGMVVAKLVFKGDERAIVIDQGNKSAAAGQ